MAYLFLPVSGCDVMGGCATSTPLQWTVTEIVSQISPLSPQLLCVRTFSHSNGKETRALC